MDNTKIDWCDSSWNPVTGCLHNCEYCYARGIAKRFGGWKFTPGKVKVNIADDKTYIYPSEDYYGDIKETEYGIIADIIDPFLNERGKCAYPFGFTPTFHRYKLDEYQNKKSRNIFVCSMADLFGEWVPNEWIEEVFKACEKAPQHNYLFLTKNPGRYCDLHRKGILPQKDNLWFGATYDHSNWSENTLSGRTSTFEIDGEMIHDAGDFYFPIYPEKRRFVSMEPLLYDIGANIGSIGAEWIIVGAETGRRKDKVVPKKEWIENILRYCKKADIPLFMKSSLADIWGEPLIREFPESLKERM